MGSWLMNRWSWGEYEPETPEQWSCGYLLMLDLIGESHCGIARSEAVWKRCDWPPQLFSNQHSHICFGEGEPNILFWK